MDVAATRLPIFIILQVVVFVSARSTQNCAVTSGYHCNRNNPCSPSLCVDGQHYYAGINDRKYVECTPSEEGEEAQCTPRICPQFTTFDTEAQQCVTVNGASMRCGMLTFNCEDRNPCSPALCTNNLTNYPGTKRSKYINCDGAVCTEHSCPDGHWYKPLTQQCVPRDQMSGCRDTFTLYQGKSFSAAAGYVQLAPEVNTTSACKEYCLTQVDGCVGATLLDLGVFIQCYVYTQYVMTTLNLPSATSFDRDGCGRSSAKFVL